MRPNPLKSLIVVGVSASLLVLSGCGALGRTCPAPTKQPEGYFIPSAPNGCEYDMEDGVLVEDTDTDTKRPTPRTVRPSTRRIS